MREEWEEGEKMEKKGWKRGGGEGRKVEKERDGRKIREGGGERTGVRGDEGTRGGSWG